MPTTTARSTDTRAAGAPSETTNFVRLRGRVSGEPVVRSLPSGDVLTTFRLVVPRYCRRGVNPSARVPTVDTIECTRWDPPGDPEVVADGADLEIVGCLRRRFWRAGGALASRYEVDVHAISIGPVAEELDQQVPA